MSPERTKTTKEIISEAPVTTLTRSLTAKITLDPTGGDRRFTRQRPETRILGVSDPLEQVSPGLVMDELRRRVLNSRSTPTTVTHITESIQNLADLGQTMLAPVYVSGLVGIMYSVAQRRERDALARNASAK